MAPFPFFLTPIQSPWPPGLETPFQSLYSPASLLCVCWYGAGCARRLLGRQHCAASPQILFPPAVYPVALRAPTSAPIGAWAAACTPLPGLIAYPASAEPPSSFTDTRVCSACLRDSCTNFRFSSRSGLGSDFFTSDPSYEVAVVNWLWIQLHATSAAGRQPVMLDIGMNSGFFAALAASLGARVYAFEPQPTCISNAALANPAAGVTMYNYTVSARNATLLVPVAACDPMNTIFQQQAAGHTVHTANLGKLWDTACIGYIDAVKIDVEGSELAVLEALLPLIESKRIGALFIEIAVPFTRSSASLPTPLVTFTPALTRSLHSLPSLHFCSPHFRLAGPGVFARVWHALHRESLQRPIHDGIPVQPRASHRHGALL